MRARYVNALASLSVGESVRASVRVRASTHACMRFDIVRAHRLLQLHRELLRRDGRDRPDWRRVLQRVSLTPIAA